MKYSFRTHHTACRPKRSNGKNYPGSRNRAGLGIEGAFPHGGFLRVLMQKLGAKILSQTKSAGIGKPEDRGDS